MAFCLHSLHIREPTLTPSNPTGSLVLPTQMKFPLFISSINVNEKTIKCWANDPTGCLLSVQDVLCAGNMPGLFIYQAWLTVTVNPIYILARAGWDNNSNIRVNSRKQHKILVKVHMEPSRSYEAAKSCIHTKIPKLCQIFLLKYFKNIEVQHAKNRSQSLGSC